MEEEIQELAKQLVEKLKHLPNGERHLVGIAGSPASGKSTLAQLLVDDVNKALQSQGLDSDSQAILVGLDGWHLTRAQLDAFPDPKLAHDRRGSHWTFDGPGYVDFVRSLRTEGELQILSAPTFGHALKDPTPEAIAIHPYHRIVAIEGLYTFLSTEPWKAASELLDERWWIEVNEEEAQRRLIKRHVVSGVAKDEEEALWRAEQNDLPNGRFIRDNMLQPTKIIQSKHDDTLSSL
ncbi:P-loop containing nucleoside triphosphate hydrolase protein [Coprinellus micaceus]|uniref:P-loop containing nucleoside triphosphate hydrolase protein n=1 Tax=Coprinellus micaceus TaxID=71717 RepID=A0A4Y7T5M5_COPMI|nr:P-loop containing nucleoside triphosphate hydrolase protein [Coprinellus micaceus]